MIRSFTLLCLLAAAGTTGSYAFIYNLEASMQFEETAGSTAVDSSPNTRTATLYGDAAFTGSGHAGGGLVLDGDGDYVAFDDNGMWNCTDEITVCAWVNLTDGGVVVARGSYISPFALIVNNSGTVTWAVNAGSAGDTRYSSTATVGWNAWHHLAATYSSIAGSSKAYLDGVQILSGPLTGKFGTADNTWLIGTRANGYWLGGTVDDIRVYSRPLAQAEIQDIVDGTESALDETEPSAPSGLQAAAVSPRQVALTWTKSTDNVKVKGYRIFKDGAYLATTHEDSAGYLVYWLEPSTQYSITVDAIDFADNISSPSSAATATTLDETYPDMYVGGWNVNNEMTKISTACMETLRTKKVVGITKSFGGSMVSGYSRLKSESSPYYLPAADIGSPTPDDFDTYVIVKADTTRYPYTFRVESLGDYMTNWAGTVVDAAFVYWHNMTASIYDASIDYPAILTRSVAVLDSLQQAYPSVKFIYTCSGVVGESDLGKDGNTHSMRFGEMLRNRKQGLVPIYDMASILGIDDAGDTCTFMNPYSGYTTSLQREMDAGWVDAADRVIKNDSTPTWQIPNSGLHPDAAGEKRMAKGMTLVLAKMFCPDCFPQAADTTPHSWVTDSLAVQAILDANGITNVTVDGVVEEKTPEGRVHTLSLRDPSLFTLTALPSVVDDLDSMRVLYVYSNELTSLPASLGSLPVLEQLNISENKLSGLPSTIGNLTTLRQLTMNDNLFSDLPEELLGLTNLVDNYGLILDNNSICDSSVLSSSLLAFVNQKSSGWFDKQACTGTGDVLAASAPGLPFSLTHTPSAISVRWEPGTAMRLTLYGVDGTELARTAAVTGGQASFDARTMPAGLYLLRLEQDGRSYTVKLAIVK